VTTGEILVALLLGLASGVALLSAVGAWLVREDLPRIHLAAPAAVFSIPLVGVVICFEDPWTPAMAKTLAVCVLSMTLSPLAGYALGRAAHHRLARAEADERERPQLPEQESEYAEGPPP
jgi:multisubunit Na+/H+ antiporter MnhG subunit